MDDFSKWYCTELMPKYSAGIVIVCAIVAPIALVLLCIAAIVR